MQRNLINLMWIILMMMWGCSKAPLPPETGSNPDNQNVGILNVSTVNDVGEKVDSAKVFLNGNFVGYSPLTLNSISFGIHTLRIQKEGYEIYSESINIDNKLPVNKEIILENLPLNTGQLLITVNQDSALTTVTNDVNEIINQTTEREILLTLDIGGYFIRCEKTGYALVLKAVEVKVDSIAIENIALQKLSDHTLPQIILIVPDSGMVNEPVLISWESTNANHVDIDYIENPGLDGKREVYFKTIGKHFIKAIAYNQEGQATVVDSIYVYEVPKVSPTISLTLSPEHIYKNGVVTLSWHSTNATEVAVDYVPNPGLSGQWQERFYNSGTYIITAYAYGPGGQAQDSDTLFVEDKIRQAPMIEVEVTPNEVEVNETVIISWRSTHATSVDVDFVPDPGLIGQWHTSFGTPGRIIVNAYAYGPGGRAHDADTVQVFREAPPRLDFSARPEEVDFLKPVTVSWQSNGYQVIIDHGVGTRGPVGSEEIIFENPGRKVITAVAYNEHNLTTSKKVTILVKEPAAPQLPVLCLSVTDVISVGQPALIEWHSWNATSVDVDYVQNPGLNGRTEVIFQTPGERIITATAYNRAGNVTVADTVTVMETPIDPSVPMILIPSGAKVCAIYPSGTQVWDDAGEATIAETGYYRITAAAWYNSGDDQKNESFFISIKNEQGAEQYPLDPNAGIYKVVPDDPGSPHVSERDAGLFYLTEGNIKIRLSHYYVIANQYPQFVVDGPITGPESIQILYFKLEYIKAPTDGKSRGV